MKKLFFTLSAVIFMVTACQNALYSPPRVPTNNDDGQGGVPQDLSATHGEKRSITLSWNQDAKAALFYIYRADSPLDAFVRCGETSSNQFAVNVAPGSTVYYRVSSVSHTGVESRQSVYVKGTSLAQPVISDITDIDESGAAVTWYMENVSDDTYKNNLLYTVYCFNGNTQVAQLALDGALINENKAFFSNLSANTRYEYQVEAYLRSNQDTSEKSDLMDAATARRFRPGPPIDLRASRGTSAGGITLSFELPDMVDIALGDNQYDPKPIYFVISKRQYSESHTNAYQVVCSYFGTILGKGGVIFDGYVPGKLVSWKDQGTGVSRGVKYEYQIQSYVDDTTKLISSDMSKISATGWALSEGSLTFGKPSYTLNDEGDAYTHAQLELNFVFDPKDETYEYVLIEHIEPLDDGGDNNPEPDTTRPPVSFSTYPAIRSHALQMNLTQKSTSQDPGRGSYSYKIEIKLGGETLDTIATIGEIEISENIDPIVVDEFFVQDGYTDRFVFKWPYRTSLKYTLCVSETGARGTYVDIPVLCEHDEDDDNFSFTLTGDMLPGGIIPDINKYFAVRPSRDAGGTTRYGQYVYASAISRTLGVPELSPVPGYSYSAITAVWSDAQKADTYRIKYKYASEASWSSVPPVTKNDLSIDAAGKLNYSFKPDGYNDVAKAGTEIQIKVDALNESLRESAGGEVSTSSVEEVSARLVGPALLELSASKATSAQEIDVSWNKIEGAGGYYVFRRQFNMNNTAEEGTEAVVYYVPAQESGSITVTGKNLWLDPSNAKIDTTNVKGAASFTSPRYTLKDIFMPDADYSGPYNGYASVYKNQQNDMAQGYPYRYYIVPVLANEPLTSIEFAYAKNGDNKNTGISSYTVRENNENIVYSGASALEKEGFVVGFGQNVTATKGTYKSNPAGNENDGILITWEKPPLLSPDNLSYTLYRKETGGSWQPLNNLSALQFVEKPTPNVAYEYMVGITAPGGVSNPSVSVRFIELCGNTRERNIPKNLGFHVAMIKIRSVTRDEQKVGNDFAEEVTWESAGIKNSFSSDNNWGIDGYTIFVMNRDVNEGWNEIADISGGYLSDVMYPNFKVTNVQGGAVVQSGLLKVTRNYKHFFMVRSYALKDSGEKVYSPEPPYEYKYWNGNAPNNSGHPYTNLEIETDYVKWGARQVTALEFVQICTGYLSRGLEFFTAPGQNNGWRSTGSGNNNWKEWSVAANYGASGRVRGRTTQNSAGGWLFEFRDYKPDMKITAPQYNGSAEVWQTFISIDGDLWLSTNTNTAHPRIYGQTSSNYREKWLQIAGPGDVSMYTGRIKIGGGVDDVEWEKPNGGIAVIYPEGTAQQRIATDGHNIALSFQNRENRFFHDEAPWK